MKKTNGITLISLIIIIVILIILAGISISMMLGNNGLFNKAKAAKQEYSNAQEKEETEIAKYTNEIDSYVSGNRETVTIPKEEYETLKNLLSYSQKTIIIGKWNNEKNIYRKLFEIAKSTTSTVTKFSIPNAIILNIVGWCEFNNGTQYPLTYDGVSSPYYASDEVGLQIYNNGNRNFSTMAGTLRGYVDYIDNSN